MKRDIAILALLALVLPGHTAVAQTSEIRVGEPVTVELPGSARVEIYGGSGHILLKRAAGSQVVVSVVKSKLAADFPVTMLKTPEGITICAVYPSDDPKKPHACLPGGKGRLYAGNPQKLPEIGINVELPDGMAASASMGAGEVRSTAITGDVTFYPIAARSPSPTAVSATFGRSSACSVTSRRASPTASNGGRCGSIRPAAVACAW